MFEQELQELFDTAVKQADSADFQKELETAFGDLEAIEVPQDLLEEEAEEEAEEEKEEEESADIFTQISNMTIPQKIKLAIFGNVNARKILIRDTNRMIPLFVLQNPRISDKEILDAAKNTNVDEGVHRAIARNGQWMKMYAIKVAIVSNPKVPIGVALPQLKHLQLRDLRMLAKSKNISSVIATQSKKLVSKREKH